MFDQVSVIKSNDVVENVSIMKKNGGIYVCVVDRSCEILFLLMRVKSSQKKIVKSTNEC